MGRRKHTPEEAEAARLRYNERKAAWWRSPAGIACMRRYLESPRGRAMRAAYRKKYLKTEVGKKIAKRCRENRKDRAWWKESHAKGVKKWREKNPEKRIAYGRLRYAVESGKITKPSACESCNQPKTGRQLHGHHHDYSKPLDVRWLCHDCHEAEHHSSSCTASAKNPGAALDTPTNIPPPLIDGCAAV